MQNFKSFYKDVVKLGKFNIAIGANASGKSNLIQAFKFLKDISEFGMDDAISMQGGPEYLFNVNHPEENVLQIKIRDGSKREFPAREDDGIGFEVTDTTYEIKINLSDKKTYVKSVDDKFKFVCELYKYNRIRKAGRVERKKSKSLGSGELVVSKIGSDITRETLFPVGVSKEKVADNVVEFSIWDRILESKMFRVGKRQSLLEADIPPFIYFGENFKNKLQNISIFDIDTKAIKKAQPITGRHDLEQDGSNLAAVIRRLVKNSSTKQQIKDIINSLLPFIEDINIKKLEDNVIIRMKEKFQKDKLFPSFLLSDGTINLTALAVVLFFENKPLKIIEEPERNIHPHLIAQIMELMREASIESQIITTTHNPEMVRYANLDDIILISRNRYGDSEISKPYEVEEIHRFLRHDLGIEELYVQNLLEKYSYNVSK